MRRIEVLDKLEIDYGLSSLLKSGIVSSTLITYRSIYKELKINLAQGFSMESAVLLVSDKMNVSRDMVYRAKREMEA